MDERVTIREIVPEDAKAIQAIRMAISPDDAQVDFEKFLARQTSEDTSKTSLVAEIDGRVVGYMVSTVLYAGFGIQKSAWIMAIGVHPDQMGQGVGLALAREICDIYKSKGIKSIYSSVLWDSIDVLSFFKKLGFERSDFINLKKTL